MQDFHGPRSKRRPRSAENRALLVIGGSRRLSGLSCRALRSLAWQAPRNWIWIRLSQEWRLKLSTSKLSLSARFSLGLGLGFLSLCLVRRGRKRSNRILLGSNRSKYAEHQTRTS